MSMLGNVENNSNNHWEGTLEQTSFLLSLLQWYVKSCVTGSVVAFYVCMFYICFIVSSVIGAAASGAVSKLG